MVKSLRDQLDKVLGRKRSIAFQNNLETLRLSDKIVLSRQPKGKVRMALIRNGKTVESVIGPLREVMEQAILIIEPNSLDGVRKVRIEPKGPKVN